MKLLDEKLALEKLKGKLETDWNKIGLILKFIKLKTWNYDLKSQSDEGRIEIKMSKLWNSWNLKVKNYDLLRMIMK